MFVDSAVGYRTWLEMQIFLKEGHAAKQARNNIELHHQCTKMDMMGSFEILTLHHQKVVLRVLNDKRHLWKLCFQNIKSLAAIVGHMIIILQLVLTNIWTNLHFLLEQQKRRTH